jgi:hypothetical protein
MILLLLACGAPDPADGPPPTVDPPAVSELVPLPPRHQLVRISTALRGVRPSAEERETTDPAARDALIDAWLDDPRFGATVRDLYAELLLMRSTELRLLQTGPMASVPMGEISRALSEEPLALIEHVVMHDRPFTEIVTADYTLLDGRAAKIWRDHDYDPQGPDLQQVRWTDGRPAAGILSTNGLWTRHPSNGANYHRGRANRVSSTLLCQDFLTSDVPIDPTIDLSDDAAVADAVNRNPACVACHQDLDPLAAHLWPFQPVVSEGSQLLAQLSGCTLLGDLCYPMAMYQPLFTNAWLVLGLRPPAYDDEPSRDVGDLGRHIAADPRFARCAADRFWSYLTQTPRLEIPDRVTDALQATFIDSGFSAKALARAVVTHPEFLARDAATPGLAAELPGPQLLRPEQLGRLLDDLTGFRMIVEVDELVCTLTGLTCYGDVDWMADDVYGMRAIAGGIDGARVTEPTHTATPTRLLALAAMAEEAAGWVVPRDLQEPDASARRLLHLVERDTTEERDEAALRAQLVALHARVLGEDVATDGPEVAADLALWTAVRARRDPEAAWKALLTAMFQSPQLLFY